LEESGYTEDASGWSTNLIDGWTVEKIKRLGASAVKLLLYYHPQAPNAASQEALLQQVAEDCDKYDIPLLVEPICFPLEPGQKKTDPAFAAQRPDLVLESARRLVPLGIDVLKAEFPTEASYAPHQEDERLRRTYCRQLNDSIDVPWVLLSAGVDFDTFQAQVGIACDEGCSGYLAGRAIWKEFANYPDPTERTNFLNTIAASRIRILNDIANYRGTPWLTRFPTAALPQVNEGWFTSY
jgi:tagatose 1,6-diphosphate aldolase